MFEKYFDNNDDYRDIDYVEVGFEVNFNKKGFQVYHDNKTFMCQNGEQLISYLKSMGVSNSQLLDLQELLLKECMKRGMKFPRDFMD